MVSAGPWVQEPDYSSTIPTNGAGNNVVVDSLDIPHFRYFDHYAAADGWHNPVPVDVVVGLVAESMGDRGLWASAFESDPVPTVRSVSWQTYNTNGTIFDPITEAYGQGLVETWVVKPPVFNGFHPGNSDLWDETSIGFEWQSEPGVHLWTDHDVYDFELSPAWQAVAIAPATRLIVGTEDDHGTPGGSGDLSGSWQARIMAGPWGGDTEEQVAAVTLGPDADGQIVLGGDPIDITSNLQAAGAYLLLHVYSPSVLAPSSPSSPSTLWSYNADFFSLQLAWGLRPPVYRWIYAETPYRRTTPVDAEVSLARRNYPPPKAQQSGRRTSGGFW